MVAAFKLELDHAGIPAFLSTPEIAEEVQKAAQKIAGAAGAGFTVTGVEHSNFNGGRVSTRVIADTEEAKRAEAEDKRLQIAVQSCKQ